MAGERGKVQGGRKGWGARMGGIKRNEARSYGKRDGREGGMEDEKEEWREGGGVLY
jgi:hypothetical protein